MNPKRIWYRLNELSRRAIRRAHRRRMTTTLPSIQDATVVFIIASPRSGTTWLQRALNEHPDITCGENRLFGAYFDVVHQKSGSQLRVTLDQFAKTMADRTVKQDLAISPKELTDDLIAGFSQVAFQKWQQYSGKRILVDKITPYPGTSQNVISSLRQFYPEAPVIQLIRDGRDVMTSGVFHWLNRTVSGEPQSAAQQQYRNVSPGAEENPSRFFTDDDIRTWAATWREPITAVSEVFGPHVLQIRYERMIEDLAGELKRICNFVGASSDPSALSQSVKYSSFERMSGGRHPGNPEPKAHVRNGIVGDWKNYFTRQDGDLFQRECGFLLQSLSYESDSEWLKVLPKSLATRGAT